MWHAKPSGAYALNSTEATENSLEINGMLNGENFTLESQAGILGNCAGESGLNPWRWYADTVDYTTAYGLFQFHPASEYFNNCQYMTGFAPNRSTSQQTSGALPSDGYCQINVLINDTLNKWHTSCWVPTWDTTTYAGYYQQAQNILNTYGNGSALTLAQFKTINVIDDAVLAFLACYERPGNPESYPSRLNYANTLYSVISGDTPVPPAPPTPTQRKKLPVWMMIKRLH